MPTTRHDRRRRPRYLRPCLSLDPATRLAQLARLTATAQAELRAGVRDAAEMGY